MAVERGQETVQRFLGGYGFGPKLRRLRLRKKLALKELGKHTGLSPSMLSQLETGKLVPTLPTLVRIAMVFDVDLEYFFSDNRARQAVGIVKASERIQFPEKPDIPEPAYFFECLNFAAPGASFSAYLAEFQPREFKDEEGHVHEGAELLFILEGKLLLRIGTEDYKLEPGDSAYFDSSEPHSYWGTSERPAKAIVVTVPPRA